MDFLQAGNRSSAVKLFFLVIGLSLVAAGCGKTESKTVRAENEKEAAGKTDAVIAVSVDKAVSREIPSYIQATGSLVADETSDVAPKVAGKVVSTSANVGSFVRQGDVIAKIDDKDARLRLVEAQAGVRQAEAGVSQAEARLGLASGGSFQATTIPEVRAANANYEQFQAELRQAEANEKRYRELVETGDTSMQNYESYRTLRDTARARLNNAKQQLEAALNTARQSNQAVKSAKANVEAAQTTVETAKQAVADTVIRAPFSGFVGSRTIAVGENVTTGTPIITLLRTNPLKLQLQVAEANVPFITLGMGVSLEVDAFKDRKFAGTVTAVNPALDPTNRAAIIEATIENGNNLLRSGMFGTARIAREGGNFSIFVPRSAVLSDPNTQSYRAFVVDKENTAKLRVVQIGTEEADTIQILSGLQADETIATSNLPQLYEGAKVQIQ